MKLSRSLVRAIMKAYCRRRRTSFYSHSDTLCGKRCNHLRALISGNQAYYHVTSKVTISNSAPFELNHPIQPIHPILEKSVALTRPVVLHKPFFHPCQLFSEVIQSGLCRIQYRELEQFFFQLRKKKSHIPALNVWGLSVVAIVPLSSGGYVLHLRHIIRRRKVSIAVLNTVSHSYCAISIGSFSSSFSKVGLRGRSTQLSRSRCNSVMDIAYCGIRLSCLLAIVKSGSRIIRSQNG